MDTTITITGVIVGDDYVIRSKRMRKALMKPGKKTLIHPWWGQLKVRPVSLASFKFHQGQIRCTSFEVQVVRDPDPPRKKGLLGRINDTVNNVLEKADELMDEAESAISLVLSAASLPLSLVSGVNSLISQCEGIWDSLTASAPEPIKSAIAPALAAASNGVVAPRQNNNGSYAQNVVSVLATLPASLTEAITQPNQSVIALPSQSGTFLQSGTALPSQSGNGSQSGNTQPSQPGNGSQSGNTQPSQPGNGAQSGASFPSNTALFYQIGADGQIETESVTGQTIAALLIAGARETGRVTEAIAESNPLSSDILALGVAAQAFVVSQLAAAWAAMEFTNNQEAEEQLLVIKEMCDSLLTALETAITAKAPISLGRVFSAVQSLKTGLTVDGNARIGSLPQIKTVPVAARSSLWSLCYAVGGDDTSQVESIFNDAVLRNGLSHPGLTPSGTLELLEMNNDS
ncbi:hypothetical protein GT348_07260 [Aristophania vespae]|uniref:DNA circulation N-terminal domain-containing protein n=1 Tax=Aristophania vespae TaxID=2697033 RepID=A0A6P1NLC4_9PROT|nr:hypothetical protein GT348_07260 [Aristophania vespae]